MFAFSWMLGCGYNVSVNMFITKVQIHFLYQAWKCEQSLFLPSSLWPLLCTFWRFFQVVNETCTRWIWPTEKSQSIMGFVQIFIQFFVPLVIIIFCYGSITYELTVRINNDQQFSSGQEATQSANTFQQAKRNTLITFAIVAFCFVICWSQNQILYLMYNLAHSVDFNGTYFNFTVLMVFLNCTINPFIYLLKYRDFQVALKEFCNCCFKRNNGDKADSSASPDPNPISVVSGKLSVWVVQRK